MSLTSEHHEVVAARYGFAGTVVTLVGTILTLIGTLVTAGVGLYTAGKKVNEASDRPVSLTANLAAGFALANPSRTLQESLPLQRVSTPSALPSNTARENVPAPPPPVQTGTLTAGTCSGLDNKVWRIEIAPVAPLKGQDLTSHNVSGYNINLRLTNLSDRPLYLKRASAELTDSQGIEPRLESSSIPPDDNSPPIEASPGAALPVNLKFLGAATSPGSTVSFSVNFHIYTQNDKPDINKFETLACTNMPL